MPSLTLNHVSYVCKSVSKSVKFYEKVLGFVRIKRPSSLKFEGAWLFNDRIGIHLIEKEDAQSKKEEIDPKDNHIAFECKDVDLITQRLEYMNIKYKRDKIEEEGVTVDQRFFHDPDGNMIEICNCENIPQRSSQTVNQPTMRNPFYGK